MDRGTNPKITNIYLDEDGAPQGNMTRVAWSDLMNLVPTDQTSQVWSNAVAPGPAGMLGPESSR